MQNNTIISTQCEFNLETFLKNQEKVLKEIDERPFLIKKELYDKISLEKQKNNVYYTQKVIIKEGERE